MRCTVCKKEVVNPIYYIAYSQVLGHDRKYPVCDECDKHFQHAAYIVDRVAIKFDKELKC